MLYRGILPCGEWWAVGRRRRRGRGRRGVGPRSDEDGLGSKWFGGGRNERRRRTGWDELKCGGGKKCLSAELIQARVHARYAKGDKEGIRLTWEQSGLIELGWSVRVHSQRAKGLTLGLVGKNFGAVAFVTLALLLVCASI